MNGDGLRHVGKHGRLSLAFGRCGGRTVLSDAYAAIPMQAMPAVHHDDLGCTCAYIVNPTGGLVDGDKIEIDVSLAERTHVFLTAPAATKVYRSSGSFASQDVRIEVGPGAVLEYLPGYVIPYAGSRCRQKTRIDMSSGSTALVLDCFATGRTGSGEHLRFREYRSVLEINYAGEAVLFEKTVLEPGLTDYDAPGFLEGCRACAVLAVVHDKPGLEKALLNGLKMAAGSMEGISAGASVLSSHGVCVRLTASGMRFMEKAVHELWRAARKIILGLEFPERFARLIP